MVEYRWKRRAAIGAIFLVGVLVGRYAPRFELSAMANDPAPAELAARESPGADVARAAMGPCVDQLSSPFPCVVTRLAKAAGQDGWEYVAVQVPREANASADIHRLGWMVTKRKAGTDATTCMWLPQTFITELFND